MTVVIEVVVLVTQPTPPPTVFVRVLTFVTVCFFVIVLISRAERLEPGKTMMIGE